jgi:hypothetical protein
MIIQSLCRRPYLPRTFLGRGRLIDARGIKQAIEQTKREREALIQASNNMAGTQETASPVTLPDEDEEMEVEETPLPAKVYLPKSLQLYNMCLFDCLIV